MLTASTRAECTKISRCCKTNERGTHSIIWSHDSVYENAAKPVCLLSNAANQSFNFVNLVIFQIANERADFVTKMHWLKVINYFLLTIETCL